MPRTKKTSKKAPRKTAKRVSKKTAKRRPRKAPASATTAPAATTQKAPAKPKKQSKTAFILGQPEGTSAKDIVKAAAALGMTISEKYVYTIRTNARRKAKQAGAAPARKPARRARRAAQATAAPLPASDAQGFKKMVLDIGIVRARALMAEIEADFRAVVGN